MHGVKSAKLAISKVALLTPCMEVEFFIYKITCEKCPTFVYIGETERSFHDRFSEHRRDAENKDQKKPCGIHFSKPGHSLKDIQAIAFEQVFPKDQPIIRKERESWWINKYQAIEHGANSRC